MFRLPRLWWVFLLVVGSAGAVLAAPRPRAEAIAQLLRVGQYEKAHRLASAWAVRTAERKRDKKAERVTAGILAARAERALGRLAEARERLGALSLFSPHDVGLRAELIQVVDAMGDRGVVKDLVNRSYDDWERGRVDRGVSAELSAMGVILRHDNNWEDANKAFRRAIELDRKNLPANLAWGDLLLEKDALGDALTCFREVLDIDPEHPDARVGVARVLMARGESGAAVERELRTALAVNPVHPGGLALLGELALDAEDFAGLEDIVRRLRQKNPQDPGAAWLSASQAVLLEDRARYARERDRRMAVRAADGDFFASISEALVRGRRYQDAKEVAADGLSRDEANPRLLRSLGNTLLRLGEEAEGLRYLRAAWDHDPYDARTYNLLNLFEKVIPAQYTTLSIGPFVFRVDKTRTTAIRTVVAPFLRRVYDDYVARYGFTPEGPIVFELYSSPEHYAVRTVGLPRLGVAGVCFGRVITSQAPELGVFNWGMVLAHEMAHVFSLQLSRGRVPRWFTEGLAELETARLRPEWRRQTDLELGAALAAGVLPSMVDLSSAFVTASDSRAAASAYIHAAVAVEYLEKTYGFARLRAALEAYGRGERGAPVLAALAGTSIEKLEAGFRAHIAQRLEPLRRQFLPATSARFRARLPVGDPAAAAGIASAGLLLLQEGKAREAAGLLDRALAAPGGKAEPTVTFLEASLALERSDLRVARTRAQALAADGHAGYDLEILRGLVALRASERQQALGHFKAAAVLAPGSVEARALLAEHLKALGKTEEALAVETELLTLEPQNLELAKRVVLGHARAGAYAEVVRLAPIAIFIDPKDPELFAAQGRALQAVGKSEAAVLALENALRFDPANPAALHRRLGELYRLLGRHSRAAEHRRLAEPPAP